MSNRIQVLSVGILVSVAVLWTNISASQSECIQLITYPGPASTPASTGKKKIVWLDIFHSGNGLRNSWNSANFKKCVGIAKRCEILPHVIVPPCLRKDNSTYGPIDADAVLIMGTHASPLPIIKRRDPNQIFVFVERENWKGYSTYYIFRQHPGQRMLHHINIFNWTMTYRHDSDILFPYGHVYPKKNLPSHLPAYYNEIWAKKKRKIAWIVSHCNTPSKRLPYVKSLQQYIEVDIYGGCGTLICNGKKCLKRIAEKYKFVLCFENTYFANYVTEKLFSWFEKPIIQVLRGGGIDYSLYGLPDKSYIDADIFDSPKELADVLNELAENKEDYFEYLRTKDKHRVVPTKVIQEAAYCNLCSKLQSVQKYRKSYTDITAWFSSKLFDKDFCPESSRYISKEDS